MIEVLVQEVKHVSFTSNERLCFTVELVKSASGWLKHQTKSK